MKTAADPSAPPRIDELVSRAQLLRRIRAASRQFLALGTLEQALRNAGSEENVKSADTAAALADPGNHDWSLLYRGSVLDD
jgi:hypothetical protein